MAAVAGTIISNVRGAVIDSVWQQILYIWNYDQNIHSLELQLEKLKDKKQVLIHRIEEARRNGEQIEAVVNKWISSTDRAIEVAEKMLEDNDRASHFCFMGCCLDVKTRYLLSKKAEEETQVLVDMREECKFDKISYPAARGGIGPVKGYESFESRMFILNQMLGALKDVDIIGLYGMGGVGKTMLSKTFAEQMKEDGIFKQVVMTTVTQNIDLPKIQQEIAEWLGLKFEVESPAVRADLLCSRLKQEKKILIVLDDVWTAIKLEDIGVPFGKDHQGCKILVTSRNLSVFWEMGIERNFKLQVLEEVEAQQLFEKKAGTLKHPEMQTIAIEAAKRCAGLPILIVAVATALKNKELYEWKDALEVLKRPAEDDMDEQVRSCLELSYNFLQNDEIKSLFLLCGQLIFYSYRLKTLLKYVVGLRLFKRCKTLEESRNRLHK